MPKNSPAALKLGHSKIALVTLVGLIAITLLMGLVLITRELDYSRTRASSSGRGPAAIETIRQQPTALFFGDSYFNGSKGVRAQDTFGPVAGKALGYRVVVRGAGETGFVTSRALKPSIPDFAGQIEAGELDWGGAEPELVVIEGGLLDRNAPQDEIYNGARRVLTLAKTKYPNAKLIVVGPADPFVEQSTGVARVNSALAEASKAATVPYVPMEDLASRREILALVGEDEVHLTPLGYQFLAERLAAKLLQLGVKEARSATNANSVGIDAKVAWSRLAATSRPFNVTLVGDSTANTVNEWGHLALAQIALAHDRPLVEHSWNVSKREYDGPVTYNATAHNAPLILWSGSASGKDGAYSLANFSRLVPKQPDVILFNHGHNSFATATTLTNQLRGLVDESEARWPHSVAYGVIIQNPRIDKWAAKYEISLLNERKWASTMTNVTIFDYYSAYLTNGGETASLLQPDQFHPNEKGSKIAARVFVKQVAQLASSR